MGILDAHNTYDATGSTDTIVTEATTGTIPAGDGASVIGLSPLTSDNPQLVVYGANVVAAAQALVSIGLSGNNIVDPTNKIIDTSTGTDTNVTRAIFAAIGYTNGVNLVNYANEAAGKTAAFKIDYTNKRGTSIGGSFYPSGFAQYSTTFGAATAGVYLNTALAPANAIPIGRYAILGARAGPITTAAFLRFQHTDFGGAFPGFPVIDSQVTALVPTNFGFNALTAEKAVGYQFVVMSQLTGLPCCPVFSVTGNGTGLNFQYLDTAADTTSVTLNLMKVG